MRKRKKNKRKPKTTKKLEQVSEEYVGSTKKRSRHGRGFSKRKTSYSCSHMTEGPL